MARKKRPLGAYAVIDLQIWLDARFQELWAGRFTEPTSVPKSFPWPYREFHDPRMGEALSKRHRFRKILHKLTPLVYARLGDACISCGSIDRIRLDHVIPIAYGGTNDVENLQPLCHHCNSRKGGMLPTPPEAI